MWNNKDGEFVRYSSTFRNWIKKEGSTPFQPEDGRYHLYVSWACPWATRTLMMRTLKGLEKAITLSVVDPVWDEKGWRWSDGPGCIPDFVNNCSHLIDVYRLAQPQFKGEESVPVLWDKKLKTIVNNESLEIIRMLDLEFEGIAENPDSFYPKEKTKLIDETIQQLYLKVNNGVYRAGFATSQRAYEKSVKELFASLEYWEEVLGRSRFLCGDQLTEADICFYPTLFRFDIVYYGHFKCNLRQLRDFPNLWNYTKQIYQIPGISSVSNEDHCKRHYYMSQSEINPNRIVPLGPVVDFDSPHNRGPWR
jgi:putative glutathione S-transferase